tara:strand:- start:506 stop:733 length:228 start_codon:yes stop_codon:yes gene_type:complete
MVIKTIDPEILWESLCDTSVKKCPFPAPKDIKRYLETVVAKEGIQCLDVPPFKYLSIEELSHILWDFQYSFISSN